MATIGTQIIAGSAGTIVPTIIMSISVGRGARNVVHDILGKTEPDVTLRSASLRSGTIEMGFAGPTSEADSQKALDIHARGVVLTLVNAERATASMAYIASGRIERELDDTTRNDWIVRIDYQEVRPR